MSKASNISVFASSIRVGGDPDPKLKRLRVSLATERTIFQFWSRIALHPSKISLA
jgi:hypothetical protein